MTSKVTPLRAAEVHLVCASDDIRDDRLLAQYASLLTPDERQRRERLRSDRGRQQFVIARALMRWLLSINSGVPPESFVFALNRWGKPTVAQPHGIALAFNVAHTRGLVACAVSRADAVGVDVELPSDRDRNFEIAERYFSRAEVEALRALPPDIREDRFFDYWTLKEAYVKGRGMGLSLPFDQFEVNLGGRHGAAVAVAPAVDDGCRWQCRLARLPTGHRLAAAVRLPASGRTFRFRMYNAVPFDTPVTGPAGPEDQPGPLPDRTIMRSRST